MRIKTYEELSISDDFLFGKIMENEPELCRLLVEEVIETKISSPFNTHRQRPIDMRPDGRGIRLDVIAAYDRGIVDLEMQTVKDAAIEKRIRYYRGLIDLDSIEKGTPVNELPDLYIIFICTFDPFGKGLSRYTLGLIVTEDGSIEYTDGSEVIFLSAAGRDNRSGLSDDLAGFLDYINGKPPRGRLAIMTDEAVRKAKEQRRWRKEYMFWEEKMELCMAEGRAEGHRQGRAEGHRQGCAEGHRQGLAEGRAEGVAEEKENSKRALVNAADNFISKAGFSMSKACEYAGITVSDYNRIKNSMK